MNLQDAAAMAGHSCCVQRAVAAIASASPPSVPCMVNRDLQLLPILSPGRAAFMQFLLLQTFLVKYHISVFF